ncbi:MAG: nonstructural protein [Microviridae sp.]|nr:MAG: nonstructural protein [Microviridae sp.]
MDNKLMFSIYDKVSELYEPPFVEINRGMALRRIQDLMKGHPDSTYSKHPQDYQLCFMGTFNATAGDIISDKPVVFQELEDLLTPKE